MPTESAPEALKRFFWILGGSVEGSVSNPRDEAVSAAAVISPVSRSFSGIDTKAVKSGVRGWDVNQRIPGLVVAPSEMIEREIFR